MSSREKWYIAGPMSGIPQCNIPYFDRWAAALRADGLQIVSPAELDDPKFREACLRAKDGTLPPGETWGSLLARDIKLIADGVTGIILLPGWQKSRGARLEAFVGLLTSKQFRWAFDDRDWLGDYGAEAVREELRNNMP